MKTSIETSMKTTRTIWNKKCEERKLKNDETELTKILILSKIEEIKLKIINSDDEKFIIDQIINLEKLEEINFDSLNDNIGEIQYQLANMG